MDRKIGKKPIIALNHISKFYGSDKVLDEINLEIFPHSLTSLMGESGVGKTTILNIIGCLDYHYEGAYQFMDQEIKKLSKKELAYIRNQHIGIVFQNFQLVENRTVYENVKLPLLFNEQVMINEMKSKIVQALESVRMIKYINQKVYKLSGGQKQKIAIARAIVNNPQIILADEPTGSLDYREKREIMDLFFQLYNENKAILIVTHDEKIAKVCPKVLTLIGGETIESILT